MSPKAKKDKAARAHTAYYDIENNKLPSVTEVIRQLGWNTNTLIAWARREALAGNDPDKIRDNAANVGTLAHYLVECHIKGVEPNTDQYSKAHIDMAKTALEAYLYWETMHNVEVVHVEQKVISEKYKYGGTIDAVVLVDGEFGIQDLKTSKRIYPEMKVQLAAYAHGWAEQEGLDEIPPCFLLRIDKEGGEFEYHRYQNLDNEWEVFKHCRELHDLQKKVR